MTWPWQTARPTKRGFPFAMLDSGNADLTVLRAVIGYPSHVYHCIHCLVPTMDYHQPWTMSDYIHPSCSTSGAIPLESQHPRREARQAADAAAAGAAFAPARAPTSMTTWPAHVGKRKD